MKHLTRLASVTALAAALATAACNRDAATDNATAQAQFALPALPATLPLESGPARDLALAPSASDLPDAAPLRLARVAQPDQAYGYADAAYGYDEAVGDAPPDYGFEYEGADPWVWQGYDDSLMVAEPIDDGYRYYYYRPGAAEPYFVRDPWYSYGFASGLLAVVYGADGGIVPYADYGPRLGYASRYYARGRQLWSGSRRGQRRPVIAATWLRQRAVILAARERWGAGRAHQPAWQHYYETNRPRQIRYWQPEQVRRQADARRFDGWREQGFRTAAPPRAIPVAWEKASWARDDRRYRPAAEALRDRREARQDQPNRPDSAPRARAELRDQAAATRAGPRAERERPTQPDRPRVDRPQRQPEQPAPDRRAEQARRQAERQAEHAERGQPDRPRAEQPQRPERAERPRPAQPERRQRDQPQPQAERPRPVEARPGQRPDAQPAERQQAQQAQRHAERAERPQSAQAQQRQAQAADRARREQAEQAGRQQAQQAQRQQAQQAQRQAQQAQRQPPAPRPQAQQQRQADRQERRAARQNEPRN